MSDLIDGLKKLQANVVSMYAQSHGYHWNVRGMLFKEIHAFFLEIYEDVFDSIDPISENIRKLGVMAPFGLSTWKDAATVVINESQDLDVLEMLNKRFERKPKKYFSDEEDDERTIISLPDLVLIDFERTEIINIEGKKSTNVQNGIDELNNLIYGDPDRVFVPNNSQQFYIIEGY